MYLGMAFIKRSKLIVVISKQQYIGNIRDLGIKVELKCKVVDDGIFLYYMRILK